MLKDIKNTVLESIIYGLSRISNKLVAFILLPIITSYLNLDEYGVYVRIESLWQILWSLMLFGMESGIIRWITLIEDEVRKKTFLFTVTLFLFILNLVFTVFIFFTSGILSDFIFGNGGLYRFIFFASLIAATEAFAFLFFLKLRIERKAVTYTILSILNSILLLAFQYYFLLNFSDKLNAIFAAKIIAPAIIVVLLIPFYVKYIKIGFEPKLLKELILYSFPIMIGSFAVTLLNQSDKFILGKFSSADTGIYGLAAYITGLITMIVISPFSLSFSVYSWQKLKDDNAKRFYTKSITYLFYICLYFALIISLFTPHFIKILTSKTDYWLAGSYVPWISIAISFYGLHFISVFSFYVEKETKKILYSYIAALMINLILNILLVPTIGITGCIIAGITSYFSLVLILYFLSKKYYFFDYEWLKLIKIIITYIIIIIFFIYINIENNIILFTLKIIALILYPVLLFIIGFYEKIEIERIYGFVNKYVIKKIKK